MKVKMNIIEATSRNSLLIEQLLGVWESSVKATHLFLSENQCRDNRRNEPNRCITDTVEHNGVKNFEENCVEASMIAKDITVAVLKDYSRQHKLRQ